MVELDDGHGGGDGLSEVKIKCSNLEKKKEKNCQRKNVSMRLAHNKPEGSA